jgi:predicted permease
MFSVVDALLLRPAPFPGGDRLVRQTLFDSEPALLRAWRTSGIFEAAEAVRTVSFQPEADGTAAWRGAHVTPGVFDLLGARPLHGRIFGGTDRVPGSPDEVILSEVLWRSAFGGDVSVVGRRIRLDGASWVVVGIMPAEFRFPAAATVAWKPLHPVPGERGPFTLVGRLRSAVPFAAAEARTKDLARELARLPRNYVGPPLDRVGEPDLSAFTRRSLWLLLAGIAIVFLVLCANVSSLLLVSLAERRREFGLCTALGASRAGLIRQASIEHALVGIAGSAAGVGVAAALTSMVPGVFEGHTLNPIDVDVRALAAASTLGTAAVLLAGLVPACIGTRTDPIDSLRGSPQTSTETRGARRATRGLLVVEVGLACSLLTGAALLVRSFVNLANADRGLQSDGAIRVAVGGMDDAFGSYDAMALAAEAIERRIGAWPAIARVTLSRELPPIVSDNASGGLAHLGPPGSKPQQDHAISTDAYRVSDTFFDFYGIRILRGRGFRPGDTEREVVVGERLARLLWPAEDPIGRTFSIGGQKDARRVVGVAGEIRLPALDPALDRPEYFTPLGRTSRTLYVSYRCAAACPGEPEVREQIQRVHPGLRARVVTSAEDAYVAQLLLPRATAQIGAAAAFVALLTAAAGLSAVLAFGVRARRRELGIRTALGASPGQMRRLVVREGMSLVVAGMGLGVAGGWVVARSLATLQYGVTTTDPVSWVGVIGTLGVSSLAAAWHPARLATRIDPVALLRED